MNEQHPDFLRTPETACMPDARTEAFVRYTEAGFEPLDLQDHYELVAKLWLNESIPEPVVIQFETSKNLLLYAWFVYRFYPVAHLHAMTVLEFGLRMCFEEELPKQYKPRGRTSLFQLLRYCRDTGVLDPKKFEVVQERAKERARRRLLVRSVQIAREEGLNKIEVDDSAIEVPEEDYDYGYVSTLVDDLPQLRNEHAHGSDALDNFAYGTLSIVAEILNQVWKESVSCSRTHQPKR